MKSQQNMLISFLSRPVVIGGILTCWSLLVTIGCGSGPAMDATVEGAVLVDGELATSGTVVFTPAGKGGVSASGQIFENGNYFVGIGQGNPKKPVPNAMPSGEYVVTVAITGESPGAIAEGGPPIAGPSLVAAKYSDPKATDLKFTVKPGKNVINLELQGAAPADPSLESIEAAEADEKAAASEAAPATTESSESTESEAAPTEDEASAPAIETPADATPATEEAAS